MSIATGILDFDRCTECMAGGNMPIVDII
jgi:hypothetical protein